MDPKVSMEMTIEALTAGQDKLLEPNPYLHMQNVNIAIRKAYVMGATDKSAELLKDRDVAKH